MKKCFTIGQVFIVADGQILKHNLTIWSHCHLTKILVFQENLFQHFFAKCRTLFCGKNILLLGTGRLFFDQVRQLKNLKLKLPLTDTCKVEVPACKYQQKCQEQISVIKQF